MIGEIILENMLPRVFRGSEDEPAIVKSQIWRRERVAFDRGKYYLIEADSGTGKSSLCAYLYGSRNDYDGHVYFDRLDIRTFNIARWCKLRCNTLAYLPQEMGLFPELTVMENIEVKNRLTSHKSRREILDMLEHLEIAHKADQPAAQLSIGQQQRVAIVRALCQPFDFLILDEPVSHLDSRNNAMVSELIDIEAKRVGAGIIATSVGNKIVLPDCEEMRL
ncbi:MAG: ATP-binding cassette domain-containing protein [Bacteroides sp.]|nr:ATP-binding cassette domain-containing protein [Bacteroides sp.]